MAPSKLQIKVNALTRLMKEEKLYRDEVQQHGAKIVEMKAANADEYEVKKMVCNMLIGTTSF
jgi:tubulin-specific chaperone A